MPKLPPTWNKSTAISSTTAVPPISPLTRAGSAGVMASSSSRLGELQTKWEESSSPKKLLYPRKSPSFIRREKEKAQHKRPKDKDTDTIAVLQRFGVENPQEALKEILAARKGETQKTEKLKVKK